MTKKNYDIIIIGGGVIGSCVAYYLSKDKDLSVALVDYKKPGNATRASAGGLWAVGESVGLGCGVIFFRTLSQKMAENSSAEVPLENAHQLPDHFLNFALKSKYLIDDLYPHFKSDYGVDFKHEKTGLKFVMYDKYDKIYAEEIARGIPQLSHQLEWLDKEELLKQEPYITPDNIGALMFKDDDQVNPYLIQQAYLEVAKCNGVDTFLQTTVTDVIKQGDKISGVVLDNNDTLHCNTVINAAGAWASDITSMALGYEIPVSPVKGQIILSERLPKILKSCISTSDCYIAQKDNGEILIGSTTEEKGFNIDCTFPELQTLSRGASKCIPYLKTSNIKRSWAGLRPGTPDELPILGPVDGVEGYLNACGHFRTGIVTSAITGQILYDVVHGNTPPVDITPYLLSRFDNKGGKNLSKKYLGEKEIA